MKMPRPMMLLALVLCLSGCATATSAWTYDAKNYPTSAEALEAARQDIHRTVSAVPQREAPMSDTALVFIPSLAWSRQVVTTTGAASEEQIRYIASAVYYGVFGMAEAIERRRIFSSTHIREFAQRDPLGEPGYDYLIWLRLDGPDSAQWMIAPGRDTSFAKPLFVSPLGAPGDRTSKFLESIELHLSAAHK